LLKSLIHAVGPIPRPDVEPKHGNMAVLVADVLRLADHPSRMSAVADVGNGVTPGADAGVHRSCIAEESGEREERGEGGSGKGLSRNEETSWHGEVAPDLGK